jgi:hypothetical protein
MHLPPALLVLLILAATPAQADTFYTYTYTGAPFRDFFGITTPPYTTDDFVRVEFTLTSPFYVFADPNAQGGFVTPVAYRFSDGHQILTEANSTASISLDKCCGPFIPTETVPRLIFGSLRADGENNGIIGVSAESTFGGFGALENGRCCVSQGMNAATMGGREHAGIWQVSVSDSPVGVPELLLALGLLGVVTLRQSLRRR